MQQSFRTVAGSARALLLILLTAVAVAACGVNLYSDADEVDLGRQLDAEIRANPKEYPILQGHPEVKAYVTGIVNQVLASPDIKKRSVYPYPVEIIHDDSTVNAFCTPGGYIYVYTGLMKFIDNEATLAGILAHEVAHAECRHATQRITAAYGIQALTSIVLGSNPGLTATIAANLFTNLGFLQNSRDDEIEADNHSMLYLRSTQYYPGAIRFFFDKIGAAGGRSVSSLEKLFLTHPPSEERQANVNSTMQQWNAGDPTKESLRAAQYLAIRKKLP